MTDPAPTGDLRVGDPSRLRIRRSIYQTLVVAAVFTLSTGPVKQIGVLYDHAPWMNDPYDTAVSFMMFFVPLAAFACALRVPLCRRYEPLPLARVRDLMRGCRIVLVGIALTVVPEWVATAMGANRSQWNWATWVQVSILTLVTLLGGKAAVDLTRTPVSRPSEARGQTGPNDWLADAVLLAERESHRLGPLRAPGMRTLKWTNERLFGAVRRHPLWVALSACIVFGATVGLGQGIAEGYQPAVTLVFSGLLSGGMFGLCVATGDYLGLVRGDSRLRGAQRRVVDAWVVTCVVILVPFALRYHLWWMVGSTNATAGLRQLDALLGISALLIFTVAFGVESMFSLHDAERS